MQLRPRGVHGVIQDVDYLNDESFRISQPGLFLIAPLPARGHSLMVAMDLVNW